MQLSIVGQAATSQRLAHDGLSARVVDFTFFPFGPHFADNKPQIERVEEISDAYHLRLGGDDVMVAYLVEVSRRTSAKTLVLDALGAHAHDDALGAGTRAHGSALLIAVGQCPGCARPRPRRRASRLRRPSTSDGRRRHRR